MILGDVLVGLAYAGIGAGIGSIGAAAITSRSGKAEARAHATDLITNAAGSLADRLDKMNSHLEDENHQMRRAISRVADALEEVIPLLPDEQKGEAKNALRAARLVAS